MFTQVKAGSLGQKIIKILNVSSNENVYLLTHDNSVQIFTKNSTLYPQLKAALEAMDADKEALQRLAE